MGIHVNDAPFSISYTREDKLHVNSILNEEGVLPDDNIVAVSAGAKSHIKRWALTGFISLCDRLNKELGLKVLLVGDDNDKTINSQIKEVGLKDVHDLSGRTNLRELAYLISLCRLIVTNDSAPLHIASAVNCPAVAIFGPTDYRKYGPLSDRSSVIREGLRCSPCEKAQCRFNLECMKGITVAAVFDACKAVILGTLKKYDDGR